tara:strand:+ start:696 stop:1328 length:633 start_codon:yes stop_codon:yes gene_type:complete
MSHTPYTYLLGWSKTNKYYYGVRYAKDCDPTDLWTTYFTSSKHVKHYSNKHGKPDIIDIRETFDSVESATEWENKVLKRMSVVNDSRFLNATANMAIICRTVFDRGANFSSWNKKSYDEKFTKEQQVELARKASESAKRQHAEGKANYTKPEDTTNYKAAAKNRWSDPKFKAKAKSRKWINNGSTSKMILPTELKHYLDSGWSLGRAGGY